MSMPALKSMRCALCLVPHSTSVCISDAGQPEMNTLAEAVCRWWRYTLGGGSELAMLLLAVLWHT